MENTEQINKIKEKLILAKKKDKKRIVFGAKSHQYKAKNPLSIVEVTAFEKEYSINLPEGYKAFITQIGNEGKAYPNHVVDKCVAGPYYGIYPLRRNNEDMLSNPLKYLQKPFTLKPMSDTEWEAVYKAIPDDDDGYDKAINELFSGILPIGSMGCTGVMGLILNGENKGKVMYLDQGLSKPVFTDQYFLDWYENWLDEILQNKDFNQKLLTELQTNDENRMIKALSSLGKFKKLRKLDDLLPLLSHSNPKIRDTALYLLTEHNYKQAKPYLLKLIENTNDEKALIAFQAIRWYVKKKKRLAKLAPVILKRLERVKEEDLLRFGLYILKNSKVAISPLLKQLVKSKNDEFRNNAYYNIGLLKDNSTFKDILIKGMAIEDKHRLITVLQAVEKLNSTAFIPHYKAILKRIPNDRYIVSNVMNLLEELGSDTFDDEIQNYLKTYFDSIEDDEDYELTNMLINFKRIPLPKLLIHATNHKDKDIAKQAKKYLKKVNK